MGLSRYVFGNRLESAVANYNTLKSVVTNYTALIIDDAVEILKDLSLNDEDSIVLWRQVILTLHRTFEHDQDGEIWSAH